MKRRKYQFTFAKVLSYSGKELENKILQAFPEVEAIGIEGDPRKEEKKLLRLAGAGLDAEKILNFVLNLENKATLEKEFRSMQDPKQTGRTKAALLDQMTGGLSGLLDVTLEEARQDAEKIKASMQSEATAVKEDLQKNFDGKVTAFEKTTGDTMTELREIKAHITTAVNNSAEALQKSFESKIEGLKQSLETQALKDRKRIGTLETKLKAVGEAVK